MSRLDCIEKDKKDGSTRYFPFFLKTAAGLRSFSNRYALWLSLLVLAVCTLLVVAYHIATWSIFQPTCTKWSCDHPLITSVESRWPSPPRPELKEEALIRWQNLHQEHVALAEAEHNGGTSRRLVFLGDSITEGWLRTGFTARRHSVEQPECAKLWKDMFEKWNPLNFGLGGDRVQDLGWRLQHGILHHSLQPDLFLVLIGTNDIGTGESATVTLSEINILVKQLRLERPNADIIIHGLLPRGGDQGTPGTLNFHRSGWWNKEWNSYFEKITLINAGLSNIVKEDDSRKIQYIECIDPFLGTADNPYEQGAEVRQGGSKYIRPELMYDLLHLTPKGYAVWADECLLPAITRVLGG